MSKKKWVAIDETEIYPVASVDESIDACYRISHVPTKLPKEYSDTLDKMYELSAKLLRTKWPEKTRAYGKTWGKLV